MWGFGEMVHLERAQIPAPFSLPCTMHLFYLDIPGLYPFIINQWSSKWNVSLSSVSRFSKLIEPKEGVVKTSDLGLIDQKHRWQPGLAIGIWRVGGAVLQDWALNLWDLLLTLVNKSELSWIIGHPAGVQELCGVLFTTLELVNKTPY